MLAMVLRGCSHNGEPLLPSPCFSLGVLYPSRLVRGREWFWYSFRLSWHDPTSLVSNAHKLLTIQHSEGSRPVSRSSRCRSRAFETRRAPAPFFSIGVDAAGVRGAVNRRGVEVLCPFLVVSASLVVVVVAWVGIEG